MNKKVDNDKESEYDKKMATVIKIDPELNKYRNKGLFQNKVDKANEIIKQHGLPKPQ